MPLPPDSRTSYAPHLRWALALALALALCACGERGTESANEDAPLIALVIVDTLRRDALGCYAPQVDSTPEIDALAAQGTRFDQAISASGWTLPSVASILTGTWPAMHKALGKFTRLTPITLDLPLAAEVFRGEGYQTLGFANAAFLSPLLGLDRGFDLFDHKHAYNWDIRRADATVDAALSALDERPSRKTFLLVHLFDAHLDYDPPEGFVTPFVGERRTPSLPISMADCKGLLREDGEAPPSAEDIAYLRGAYQGEIAFVDRAIGRMVEGLKELGRWDNTTLVITADHGEEFWDHGGFEHGHTLYDELVRVPLIIHLPTASALLAPVVERQVRTIDIMPTLFELAGIDPGPSFIGQSLVADLHGQQPARIPPAFSQGTLYGAEKLSWRKDGYNLIVDLALKGPRSIELYDLNLDPLELHDLSDQRPELAQKMGRQLAGFQRNLMSRAKDISVPELRDMSPARIKKYLKSLETLGYTGRDSD